MLQGNRTTNYIDSLHEVLLKGVVNNISFRINFCPLFILNIVECDNCNTILVVTDNKENVIRQLDFQFQELNKVFDYYKYDRSSINTFRIDIDGVMSSVTVIDKCDISTYFRSSNVIFDLTEYGFNNALNL